MTVVTIETGILTCLTFPYFAAVCGYYEYGITVFCYMTVRLLGV